MLMTLGGDAGLAQLTDARLAFNIACMHAKLGRKDELLRWAGRALGLGKPPEQFREDADFSAFLRDPDFVNLLAEGAR